MSTNVTIKTVETVKARSDAKPHKDLVIDISPSDDAGFNELLTVAFAILAFSMFGWLILIVTAVCGGLNEILGPAAKVRRTGNELWRP